jgi:hypothetical protein
LLDKIEAQRLNTLPEEHPKAAPTENVAQVQQRGAADDLDFLKGPQADFGTGDFGFVADKSDPFTGTFGGTPVAAPA